MAMQRLQALFEGPTTGARLEAPRPCLASDGSPTRRYMIDAWSFFSQTKEISQNGYHTCCVLQLRAHSSSHPRDAAFPCRQSLAEASPLGHERTHWSALLRSWHGAGRAFHDGVQ